MTASLLSLLLLPSVSLASDEDEDEDEEEEAEDPPRSYDLTEGGGGGELGSALEGVEAAAAEEAATSAGVLDAVLSEVLPSALQRDRLRLRGHLWLRPQLAVGGVAGQSALLLGGAAGHRWWGLSEDAGVVPGGETRLEVLTPVGGAARGLVTTLSSTVGPWLGPVGLQVGPVARFEEATWTSAAVALPPALLGGGRGTLSVDLADRLQLYGGHERTWALAGEREGTVEPAWLGGAAVRLGWLHLRTQATVRAVGDEEVWQVGLGVGLRPQLD